MDTAADYLNFLKIFYQDELYLIDSVETAGKDPSTTPNPQEDSAILVEEPLPEKWEWNSIGNPNASVAFMLKENSPEPLPEEIRERFTAMLKNLNLDVPQVFIANVDGESGKSIKKQVLGLQASKIVLLGSNEILSGTQCTHYQPISYGSKHFLPAPAFSQILEDKKKVLAFWNALKTFI